MSFLILLLLPAFFRRGRVSHQDYPYDPRIHNFGNTGVGGRLHSLMAPLSTYIIDQVAYKGLNVRQHILGDVPSDSLDYGCGTGWSTRTRGVDTSAQMLDMARHCHPQKEFVQGNAETFGETNEVAVCTCMFLFHEMPPEARRVVLDNMRRVARDYVLVADIHPSHTPSQAFLSGEPYALNYLEHTQREMEAWDLHSQTDLAGGRVRLWNVTASS